MHIHAAIVPPGEVLDHVAAALGGIRTGTMERIPSDHLQLVVAGFGNVTADDSRLIRAALADLAVGLPRPTLVFVGPEVVDTEYGTAIAARIDGDVDALAEIARAVTRCVANLGFYVDRRRLNPWLEIARTRPGTSASEVSAVVEALRDLDGLRWEVDDLHVLATLMSSGESRFSEVQRFALGSSASV